jgi:hypothetical protein
MAVICSTCSAVKRKPFLGAEDEEVDEPGEREERSQR